MNPELYKKLSMVATIARYVFTLLLVYGVYTETGIWTAIAFALIALKFEIE